MHYKNTLAADPVLTPRMLRPRKTKPFYSLKPYKTMKKFLFTLMIAGVSATTAWAQTGGALSAFAPASVTVSINNYLSIQVIYGDDLQFDLTDRDDYQNTSLQRLSSGLRVSSAMDNAAVTVSAASDLTDAVSGLSIPISEVSVGITGGALTPLNLSTPVSLVSGISRGTTDHVVDVSVEGITFGEYAVGAYTAPVTYTVTQM